MTAPRNFTAMTAEAPPAAQMPQAGEAAQAAQVPGDDTASRMHGVVRSAFLNALGLAAIGDDADFFDAGGDSLMALSLLQQVEEALGITLPISALYDATSVATLSARLLNGMPGDTGQGLIALRPAQAPHAGPPLFLLHGLGGSVLVLRDLAKSMPGRRAVWGIEAQGLSGEAPPQDNVADMAAHALAHIRAIAPHGPYLLAGYSFGGLIALEVARQLRGSGEHVALLAQLDSFPHPKTWRRAVRARAFIRQSKVYLAPDTWRRLWAREREKLRGKPVLSIVRRLARGAVRAATLPADVMGTAWVYDLAGRAPRPAEMLAPLNRAAMSAANADTIETVTAAARHAFEAYVPRYYDGDMLVLHATELQIVPFTPRAVWGHLVRRLSVVDLPTDHQALVRGAARMTAAALGRAIDAALKGPAR